MSSPTYNPYSLFLEEERIKSSKDEFGQEQNEYNDEDQGSNDEKQEKGDEVSQDEKEDEVGWTTTPKKPKFKRKTEFKKKTDSPRCYCIFKWKQEIFLLLNKNSWEFHSFKFKKKRLDVENITDDEKKLIEGILSEKDGIEKDAKSMFGFKKLFECKSRNTFTFKDLKSKINNAAPNLEAKPNGEKHYCLPGGGVEENEEEEEVLKRECGEEIGFKNFKQKQSKRRFSLKDPSNPKKKQIFWIYNVDDDDDDDKQKNEINTCTEEKLKGPDSEFDSYEWVSKDNFKSKKTYYDEKFSNSIWE
eukprot:gene12618-6522_t